MKSVLKTLSALACLFVLVLPLRAEDCSENRALDGMKYKLSLKGDKPVEVEFTFRSCSAEPRNDLQPPYETRVYSGNNGKYDLIIVTDEGSGESEVMLYERVPGAASEYAGKLGKLSNKSLSGADAMPLGDVTIGHYRIEANQVKGSATLSPSSSR